MALRINTVSEPFTDPKLALPAIAALERAEAMGLLPDASDIHRLDEAVLRRVLATLATKGIAVGLRPLFGRNRLDPAQVQAMIERLVDSLDGSPMPAEEVRSLASALEPALVARLVGVSPVTVNRWLRRERTAEGMHAARLHWLSGVVADLRTAYNELGTRRWFQRARPQLDGQSPADLLGRTWDPDGEPARRVRDLAAWLTSPAAT
jgi:hypothetical protein